MITLNKLIPPENQRVFADNPELNDIWELQALQDEARNSYEQWGMAGEESTGEIFSIKSDNRIVGIVGWFEYGDIADVLRLRYYGIIPSQRGQQYGQKAVRLLLEHLSCTAPSRFVWLAESITLSRTVAGKITTHFREMGFAEFDDPNYGSNAGCGKVLSLRIRIPLR